MITQKDKSLTSQEINVQGTSQIKQEESQVTKKYFCQNHPNGFHNTDQCRLNRANNGQRSNQRNFQNYNSNKQQRNNNYNNSQGNNNNNNNNNNNRYRPNNSRNSSFRQGNNQRQNSNGNLQNPNNRNGNFPNRGCILCGNQYHTINNCAQFQIMQN